MVDIQYIAASSHPSCQEWETEGEATSYPKAGQPRCAGACATVTATVSAARHQRSASAGVPPPPAAAAGATMAAICQLLDNPPPLGTSPSAAEQWRHNVDQVVVAIR
jgi:hypothetical protein